MSNTSQLESLQHNETVQTNEFEQLINKEFKPKSKQA